MADRHPERFKLGQPLENVENTRRYYYPPPVHYQQQPGSIYTSIQGKLLLFIDQSLKFFKNNFRGGREINKNKQRIKWEHTVSTIHHNTSC